MRAMGHVSDRHCAHAADLDVVDLRAAGARPKCESGGERHACAMCRSMLAGGGVARQGRVVMGGARRDRVWVIICFEH